MIVFVGVRRGILACCRPRLACPPSGLCMTAWRSLNLFFPLVTLQDGKAFPQGPNPPSVQHWKVECLFSYSSMIALNLQSSYLPITSNAQGTQRLGHNPGIFI